LGDRDADAVDTAALLGLNLVEFSFGEERRMRIKRMKHSAYRVLAEHLEVNLSGVALLYLGDCFFEILCELIGQSGVGIGYVRGTRRRIITAGQCCQRNHRYRQQRQRPILDAASTPSYQNSTKANERQKTLVRSP